MNSTSEQSGDRDVSISIGVVCGLLEVWALLRTWNWAKRMGKQPVDPMSVTKFFILSAGLIANAFLLVVIGVSFNWFIVYKRSATLQTRLPTANQQRSLHIYLFVAIVLKTVNVIHELVILCKVDVFFIDWERPKIRAHKTTKDKSVVSSAENKSETSSKQAPTADKENASNLQEKLIPEFPVISIWRTYFVANEWVKLSAYRKLSSGVQLFFVLLLLNTFELEKWSSGHSLQKTSTKEYNKQLSAICRISVGSLVYIVIALSQILFHKFIYMRIIKDKLHEFVDLCSVSNVSVFCFKNKKFGYYIHGRSPNGYSDVNMKEMHEFLKREEEDLCPKRGLLPNTDQQTFEMSLPCAVNDNYKRIRKVLTSYTQATDRMQGIGGNLFKVDIEKVIPTYHTINKFLSGFIEHAYKDVDYTVKDKSTIEMILDTEFSEPVDKGFFYNGMLVAFVYFTVLLCIY
ncbi:Meckelin-like protein [Leptotrombidium deliense]|uniref:Meckelin-like protein n=1 Tax=Leptotrombidium deliense TaxID=299467 RepID=A0A443SQ89_9ACAR|nr:Meckelin-like protein [Leptotrombidium deliense]